MVTDSKIGGRHVFAACSHCGPPGKTTEGKKILNRHVLLLSSATLALLSSSQMAHAQREANYPSKPIRLMIGYVPGGAADFTARLLAQRLQATR